MHSQRQKVGVAKAIKGSMANPDSIQIHHELRHAPAVLAASAHVGDHALADDFAVRLNAASSESSTTAVATNFKYDMRAIATAKENLSLQCKHVPHVAGLLVKHAINSSEAHRQQRACANYADGPRISRAMVAGKMPRLAKVFWQQVASLPPLPVIRGPQTVPRPAADGARINGRN
jgi:hypothetical protein